MSVDHPLLATLAVLPAVLLALLTWRQAGGVFAVLVSLGAALLAFAASGPGIRWSSTPEVVVMVDVSPSTRGAAYHDLAELERRVRQLVGGVPWRVTRFADGPLREADERIEVVPAERTGVDLPDVDAVLLLSDGLARIKPSRARVFALRDPALDRAADSGVRSLARVGTTLLADVVLAEPMRVTIAGEPWDLLAGRHRIEAQVPADRPAEVAVDGQDAWPENDRMTIGPGSVPSERWWVGASPPPGFIAIEPHSLPTDAGGWLACSLAVLSNTPADALAPAVQRAMATYVSELGGSVLILGGDRGFAAGGYAGTPLDALSPLASVPPATRRTWVLLIDASGSMSADAGGRSRLRAAVDAARAAVRSLPPNDAVRVGLFARDLRWVGPPAPAGRFELDPNAIPQAGGPTNLEPSLRHALTDLPSPAELLLASDAAARIDDAPTLIAALAARQIRVSLLALDQITPHNPVRRLVQASGGAVLMSASPDRWAVDLANLATDRLGDPLLRGDAMIDFVGDWGPMGRLPTALLNRTWPREGIEPIATAGGQTVGASWNVGTGRVTALAASLPTAKIAGLVGGLARSPGDPRFTIRIDDESVLRITVDAVDSAGTHRPMNNLDLRADVGGRTHAIPQVAPGTYALEIERPTSASILRVLVGSTVLRVHPLPTRPKPEFETIGTDGPALAALAALTGGRVVDPYDTRPLDLRPAAVRVQVGWVVALLAGGLIMSALLFRRLR